MASKNQVFKNNGIFFVPNGIRDFFVCVVGGGGGANKGTGGRYQGASTDGWNYQHIDWVAGDNGGASSFGEYLSANGGIGAPAKRYQDWYNWREWRGSSKGWSTWKGWSVTGQWNSTIGDRGEVKVRLISIKEGVLEVNVIVGFGGSENGGNGIVSISWIEN